MKNPNSSNSKPPPIVLVTGIGGTGKSHLIYAIVDHGIKHNNIPLQTAFNNLNAAYIGGVTISSLLKDGFSKLRSRTNKHKNQFYRVKLKATKILQELYKVKKTPLLVIGEFSDVSATVLGRLSELFAIARECPHEPFGGLPVIFFGDMNQKGPCGAKLLNAGLMKYVHGKVEELEY